MRQGRSVPSVFAAAVVGLLVILMSACTYVEATQPGEAPKKTSSQPPELSDQQIRQLMIQQSIRRYSGNCPCPYNSASNGSRCGGRSAYSRPGGASPLCYASDISDEMVEAYRKRIR